ncbi:MAG TPA: hypothetical protein DCP92_09695 [Nitrospiraceae bacterium]|nr:hypothetical protein [Nitrospiraceae bacterium]
MPEMHDDHGRGEKRRRAKLRFCLLKRYVLFFGIIVVVVFMLQIPQAQAVYWFYDYDPTTVYNLHGQVDLDYERVWYKNSNAVSIFRSGITLGLSGFIVDRRLALFDIGGSFSNGIATGSDTVNAYSISTHVSLLNEAVRRGLLQYFPQPIRLSFAYSDDGEGGHSVSYGLGLGYHRPGMLRFFQNGKIFYYDETGRSSQQKTQVQSDTDESGRKEQAVGKEGFYLAYPLVTLDYDRGTFSGSDESISTDTIDFRAESYSKYGQYLLDYQYNRYNGSDTPELNYQHFEFDANFRIPGADKTSRFESWNSVIDDKIYSSSTLNVTTNNVWMKSLGPQLKDSITLSGGGYYTQNTNLSTYNLSTSGLYMKQLSERLRNSIYSGVTYEQSDGTFHSESISDSVWYRVAPALELSAIAGVGNATNGPVYNGGVTLALTKRIYISLGYDYSVTQSASTEEAVTPPELTQNPVTVETVGGKQTEQQISLNLSGAIGYNLSFTAQNFYRITDTSGTGGYTEKQLDMRGDVYWAILAYRLSLGYVYVSTDESNLVPSRVSSTALRLTLSRFFERRRLFLSISGYYLYNNDGTWTYSVYPMALWNYRMVTVSAEYQMVKTNAIGELTDNRFILRVTRKIDYAVKPFLGSNQ